ncbi:MAG: hypothetical protein NC452_09275 [Eubacterium sp.]|nr:hypothetical protein [Eubacterium sp.]
MAIDVLLLLGAAFLLITSLIFNRESAPKIFSHRIYIVETEAFSLVKKGSALVAEQTEAENIAAGNIVIFSDDEERARIAEVQDARLEDGVYIFEIKNDLGEKMTIGQSRILGKGMYYSEAIGALVSFALSPLGVCFVAVLPCAAFIVLEVIASLKRGDGQPEFETVKKQDEVPTYIPPRQSSLLSEDRPAFAEGRERLMEEAGLFTPPQKKTQRQQEEHVPISERDIDKLIRETRAKHLNETLAPEKRQTERPRQSRPIIIDEEETRDIFERPVREQPSASAALASASDEELAGPEKRSEPPKKAEPSFSAKRTEDPVRRYEPPKRTTPRLAPRVSRLDSLLQEETSDSHYDIDDILKSLERH